MSDLRAILKDVSEENLKKMALKIEKVLANNNHSDNTLTLKHTTDIWTTGRGPRMDSIIEGSQIELKNCRYGKRDKLVFGCEINKSLAKRVTAEISAHRLKEMFEGEAEKPFHSTESKTLEKLIGQMIMFNQDDIEIANEQVKIKKEDEIKKHTSHITGWGDFA